MIALLRDAWKSSAIVVVVAALGRMGHDKLTQALRRTQPCLIPDNFIRFRVRAGFFFFFPTPN